MKPLKGKNLETKTDDDLRKLLSEKRDALRSFRFNIAGSKKKNVKEGRDTRKDIARILTEVRRRSLISAQGII